MASVLSAISATAASGESLWVDELHTSWTISGNLSDVASRARMGNQSPVYFWGLYLASLTPVPDAFRAMLPAEFLLRLPAILGWGLTTAVCLYLCRLAAPNGLNGRQAARRYPVFQGLWAFPGGLAGAALFAWIVNDRIQLFYATEARVYELVQCTSLLAWACLGISWTTTSTVLARRMIIGWCIAASVLVQLHVTAALAIGWQITVGSLITHYRSTVLIESSAASAASKLFSLRSPPTNAVAPRQASSVRWEWSMAVVVVLCSCGIAALASVDVWNQREQWQSFAGDASLTSLLHLFPFTAVIVPLILVHLMDLAKDRGRRLEGQNEKGPNRWFVLWLVAATGPGLTAWLVTAAGIAPILHRRYLFFCAVPLYMMAYVQLGQVRGRVLRGLAAGGVLLWLLVSQGTLSTWLDGRWMAWQRVEDWRGATSWLQTQYRSGDELWCASALIEGRQAPLPLSPAMDEYLSFPLRGMYAVRDAQNRQVSPRALAGQTPEWPEQIAATESQSHWIVYRGSLANLRRKLSDTVEACAENGLTVTVVDGKGFGLVSVAKLSIAR